MEEECTKAHFVRKLFQRRLELTLEGQWYVRNLSEKAERRGRRKLGGEGCRIGGRDEEMDGGNGRREGNGEGNGRR